VGQSNVEKARNARTYRSVRHLERGNADSVDLGSIPPVLRIGKSALTNVSATG
jgi:hypothetical protein